MSKPVLFDWGALTEDEPLTEHELEAKAQDLLAQMSLDEKIHQMSGDGSYFIEGPRMLRAYNPRPIPAGVNPRLGLPGVQFSDGPRGVVMYNSTCFPVSMARGASWDIELEQRIGDAIGVEARSQGANFFAGVCINLLRHPAWGRAQETYGEDPYHLGEMGAALVRGAQRHLMACAKHYACNSIENARFKVDVKISPRVLREVYLPHFKRCVDEGLAAVMSAYNRVNGDWCGHNNHLLREILKGDWGFDGFVISDFVYGLHDGKAAALGGLDLEMPFTGHYGRKLRKLVESGDVPQAIINDAVLRILRTEIRFAQIGELERYDPHSVVSPAFVKLAREVAAKSMVLLKNEPPSGAGLPLLPIDRARVSRIALIGELADIPNTGDLGSSQVRPPYVVTPLQGLQAALDGSGIGLDYQDGKKIAAAVEIARDADIAIVVAGYTYRDEGEYIKTLWSTKGGDRDSLRLHPHDEALIQAVASANPCTLVVMVGGSAIITEAWRESVPAILMAWYGGMQGGFALVDILFGTLNPSGKLPCVFPKSEDQLPFFDKNADSIEYGYYHGYRLLDVDGEEPAFAFGFGLSYTTFEYRELHLDQETIDPNGMMTARVEITNTGSVAGDEIAQLYIGYVGSRVDRPLRELKGFTKVSLQPGETRQVTFNLPAQRLAYYNESRSEWSIEKITYLVYVGSSSAGDDLLSAQFRIVEQ